MIGASFIGLEVAASLRARGIDVHVVAPDASRSSASWAPKWASSSDRCTRATAWRSTWARRSSRVDGRKVTLSDGQTVEADVIVAGVGVRPSIAWAEQAGLAIDKGLTVNEYLETSAPGVFAAGDVARWPDPHTGDRIRVEHWVVAERQGQVAAKNMLGLRERFDAVPFFWSQHYDVTINYVGHAEKWDEVEIDGSLGAKDATVTYKRGGRVLAVATVYRDMASLEAERDIERARS